MPKPIEFGEWRPDLASRTRPACEARGVISASGQYAPFRSPEDYGPQAQTDATCVGVRTVYDSTTTPQIFMGDASALYRLESRIAVDRSKSGGYSLGSEDAWAFEQFGDNVVAVARNTNPQHFDMATPANDFDDLAGSPPQFTSIARVNDFLMGGIDYTVHWSAFNDITDWTPDAGTQAGNQELDQGAGEIQTIVGLDYAAIFQERGIRRAIYVGPPIIWDFGQDYVEKRRGSISKYGAAAWGRHIYFVADDGFYVFDGQQSHPIGYGKVDNYFVRNVNYAARHKITIGFDGENKLVVFGIPTGSSQFISELLIYSIQDGRWTHDVLNLEWLFDTPAEPFTVDNFDLLYPSDDLDDPTIDPNDIDSATFSDRRRNLAGVSTSNHRLQLFTGDARPATIETNEFELLPGRRGMLTEIWPMGDMEQGAVSASVGIRKALPGATIQYTNPTNMNRAGFCPQRIDARFLRGRLMLAAGSNWRRMEGMHYTAVPTGGR